MSDSQSNPEGDPKPAEETAPKGVSSLGESSPKGTSGSTPEVSGKPSSANQSEGIREVPPKTKQVMDQKPASLSLRTRITLIIQPKVEEAYDKMHGFLGTKCRETVIESETKRRVDALFADATKYIRNRAKSEKVTPWEILQSEAKKHGIKTESGKAEKGVRKTRKIADQKGDEDGGK